MSECAAVKLHSLIQLCLDQMAKRNLSFGHAIHDAQATADKVHTLRRECNRDR